MIEITCQTCAEKVGVESFLTAAQQPCTRCGNLLMGALSRSKNTYRPSDYADIPSQPYAPGRGSKGGLWVGVFAGGVFGIAGVVALAFFGPAIPAHIRGAILGALMGVVLAPVIAIVSFIFMLIPGLNLIGMIGDSAWNGLARALHEGKIRYLWFPMLIFVVLPMAALGYGGSKMNPNQTPMLVAAGLGAAILGGVLGGVFGSRSRGS
jgi:hypothetical protein